MCMQAGRDALIKAPTGSGKTLAYLAPIVHDLQVGVCMPSMNTAPCRATHQHPQLLVLQAIEQLAQLLALSDFGPLRTSSTPSS